MNVELKEICKILCPLIKKIPIVWDGKNAILEMKNDHAANWKQMEWIGFYFEHWCKKNLKNVMQMPFIKKYGNVTFDGFLKIPWDFKTHSIQSGHTVIINDSEAISNAINEFGCICVILVLGNVTYDNNGDFKIWHDELKGGKSNYEHRRIERGAPSRRRKMNLQISKILFVRIDDELLVKCGTFQKDFRNSNGKPRRSKVLLDLRKIDESIEYSLIIS